MFVKSISLRGHMLKNRYLPILTLAALCGTSIAHAQTAAPASGCDGNSSGSGILGQLANKENCLNDRMKGWQEKNKASQEARQKQIDNLRNKAENAPAREKQKLQDQINAEKGRISDLKKDQTKKLDQWRANSKEQNSRLKALTNKTKQDFTNFRNGQ